MRSWPPWAYIGIAVALVESLVLIRLWPERRSTARQVPRGETSNVTKEQHTLDRRKQRSQSPKVNTRLTTMLPSVFSVSSGSRNQSPYEHAKVAAQVGGLATGNGNRRPVSAYLLVLLLESSIDAWRHRPQPGMQVSQQWVAQGGSGARKSATPINYLLYLPPEYTSRSKWPLVVYLHGAGARGPDINIVRHWGLPGLIEHGKKFGFILLSPQCARIRSWARELVVGLIEHVSNSLSVDRERVYLTGYSMGGFGTWAAASPNPDRFAAIAPLCGGGDVSQAERLAKVPIWVFHGARGHVVPFKASRTMVEAVRKSGGRVEFTVYPDRDHDICELTYQNEHLYEWLLAQRRIPPLVKSPMATKEIFRVQR